MAADPVTLRFAATTERVRLARVLVASLADGAGFDYDDVEDLRIAVDELCFLVLDTASGRGELEIVARAEPGDLQVEGTLHGAGDLTPTEPSEISTQILRTVVDSYELHLDGTPRFRFRKSKT
jgi:anti-sigma regulatory factor (Ser/Thr protein kinase)